MGYPIDVPALSHVLFDLNGTLVDPSVMAEPLGGDADARSTIHASLDEAVTAGMVESLTGSYRPFSDLLRVAVERRLAGTGHEGALDEVMDRARRMPPFPDSGPAVALLAESGISAGVLTNSESESARGLLTDGLDRLDPVIGSERAGAFKPDPRVYTGAVEVLGAAPEEVLLISAHWWDVIGAKRCGLSAAWVARGEQWLDRGAEPDTSGEDLVGVAHALGAGQTTG